jgi:hypothetical protein
MGLAAFSSGNLYRSVAIWFLVLAMTFVTSSNTNILRPQAIIDNGTIREGLARRCYAGTRYGNALTVAPIKALPRHALVRTTASRSAMLTLDKWRFEAAKNRAGSCPLALALCSSRKIKNGAPVTDGTPS